MGRWSVTNGSNGNTNFKCPLDGCEEKERERASGKHGHVEAIKLLVGAAFKSSSLCRREK